MIYAPTFAECEQCGSFWEPRAYVARLCPVCVESIRASAREAARSVHFAIYLERAGLALAALAVLILLVWRLL